MPPAGTEAGVSVAVTPAGRLFAVSATVPVKPDAAVVVTLDVSVATWPADSGAKAGSRDTSKSVLPPPPTIGCDIRQPPVAPLASLAHVDCIAKAPLVNGT